MNEVVNVIINLGKFAFSNFSCKWWRKKLSKGSSDTSLSFTELLFDIEVYICNKFPSLSPLELDEYRAIEVMKFIRTYNEHVGRCENDNQTGITTVNNKKVRSVMVMD